MSVTEQPPLGLTDEDYERIEAACEASRLGCGDDTIQRTLEGAVGTEVSMDDCYLAQYYYDECGWSIDEVVAELDATVSIIGGHAREWCDCSHVSPHEVKLKECTMMREFFDGDVGAVAASFERTTRDVRRHLSGDCSHPSPIREPPLAD